MEMSARRARAVGGRLGRGMWNPDGVRVPFCARTPGGGCAATGGYQPGTPTGFGRRGKNRFPYNGNVFSGGRKTVFHTMETCFAGTGEEVTGEG